MTDRVPLLVSSIWQEAAISNAAMGYPWAVWIKREYHPATLYGSFKTKEEADRSADEAPRKTPFNKYPQSVFVCNEKI